MNLLYERVWDYVDYVNIRYETTISDFQLLSLDF